MAVYTHVSEPALREFLRAYDIGELVEHRGVAQGVENTNYFLTTTVGRYVLTLFERRVAEAEIPYFLSVMAHFADAGIDAPRTIVRRDGARIGKLAERPAIIISFLDGQQRMSPTPEDCAACGELAARMHQKATGFDEVRENSLSLSGWRSLAEKCAASEHETAKSLRPLIADEIEYLSRAWPSPDLPRGVVHADLFPDNVFFLDDKISGVIDFYFSCTDYFTYDLAVCLNAWSSDNGVWRQENAAAMLSGYLRRRALTIAELAALPIFLRGAALRFLLTRLYDLINQVDGAVVKVKDPMEYAALLRHHREYPLIARDFIR
jgi:homoserine kinase type II